MLIALALPPGHLRTFFWASLLVPPIGDIGIKGYSLHSKGSFLELNALSCFPSYIPRNTDFHGMLSASHRCSKTHIHRHMHAHTYVDEWASTFEKHRVKKIKQIFTLKILLKAYVNVHFDFPIIKNNMCYF